MHSIVARWFLLGLTLSWPEIAVDLSHGSAGAVAVDPNGTWWIAGRQGRLYRSADRGEAWTRVELPFVPGVGGGLADLAFFDEKRALLAWHSQGERGRVLVTRDGGTTWRFVATGFDLHPYDAWTLEDGAAWLVGPSSGRRLRDSRGRILVSGNHGESWTEVPFPPRSSRQPYRVCFSSRQRGVVGSAFNSIDATADGGATWSRLPTPWDQHGGTEERPEGEGSSFILGGPQGVENVQVSQLSLWDHRVLAAQKGVVYVAGWTEDPEWRAVRTERGCARAFALHPEGLAVLDEAGHVALLDGTLAEVWATLEPVDIRWDPSHMRWGGLSVAGTTVLLFDGRRRLARIDRGTVEISRLFLAPDEGQWTIHAMDRAQDGTLWGVAREDLLRSEDGGRTWSRIAELPARKALHLARIQVLDAGDPLFFPVAEAAVRWNTGTGRFEDLADLSSVLVSGVERRDDVWIAFGGRDRDDYLARLRLHQLTLGDDLTGLILGSTDGHSWQTLHEWPGGFVEALYWSEEDRIVAVRAGGVAGAGDLRRDADGDLRLDFEPAELPDDELPIQFGTFRFEDERTGLLSGVEVYGPVHVFRTADGGASWEHVGTEDDARELGDSGLRLGSGVRVRKVEIGYRSPPLGIQPEEPPPEGAHDELQIRRGGSWVPLRRFDAPLVRCTRDTYGGLLVETADGALLRLEPDAATWQTLRPADV